MRRTSRITSKVNAGKASAGKASAGKIIAGVTSAVQPERPTVWSLWKNLSTLESADMAASEADRSRMIERHKLVVNIIEINSLQLRCESAKAGLDIERACARRDAALPDAPAETKAHVAALERKMDELTSEAQRLESQREFLNATLSEFDGTASDSAEAVGRA